MVFHIRQSTSNYIAKQYEIITLIIIRRIFKDLANLDLSIDWFKDKYDLQFTYDIITTLVLFVIIFFFHRLIKRNGRERSLEELPEKVQLFIKRKKSIALILVPIILTMAIYSFITWSKDLYAILMSNYSDIVAPEDINNIFFDAFFTVLILADVLLLLFSFFHTSSFHIFMRNSGFIISTILIRISFSVDGLTNNILIVVAVLFGTLILYITQLFSKIDSEKLKV